MRGRTVRKATFTAITPDHKVPRSHPIRRIRTLVEPVLKELAPGFEGMYAEIGRPSIPPEHLLKATLLMTPYSVTATAFPWPFCYTANRFTRCLPAQRPAS